MPFLLKRKKTTPALCSFWRRVQRGSRDDAAYADYFTYFAEKGFVVVSIDYRLGMKDAPAPEFSIPSPAQRHCDGCGRFV